MLVCEGQGPDQGFGVLWHGLMVNHSASAGPVLLQELAGITVAEMWTMEDNSWRVTSTLLMTPAAQCRLLQLFCQIQLLNGTLLHHSQVMDLHNQMEADLCTQPLLVEDTLSCASPQLLTAEQALGPTSATPTGSEAEMLPVTLYVVVAIIAVFVVVIISLTLVVVLLYRRKCAHLEVVTQTGELAPLATYM
jgi:hypothetical protein